MHESDKCFQLNAKIKSEVFCLNTEPDSMCPLQFSKKNKELLKQQSPVNQPCRAFTFRYCFATTMTLPAGPILETVSERSLNPFKTKQLAVSFQHMPELSEHCIYCFNIRRQF